MKRLSEINEGVFRNSIVRTSGTGLKRREEQMDYTPIDLGLPSGTLWCDRNVGAISPEDYGGYFQWAGTEDMTEKDCNLVTCPYWNDKRGMFEKYNGVDKKRVLEPEDDAATVHMGGDWHMPTAEQCNELLSNTDKGPASVGGVEGMIFKSRKNGNSIFIPASGGRQSSSFSSYTGKDFHVWSSSVSSNDSKLVYNSASHMSSVWYAAYEVDRHVGFSVRGVIDNR